MPVPEPPLPPSPPDAEAKVPKDDVPPFVPLPAVPPEVPDTFEPLVPPLPIVTDMLFPGETVTVFLVILPAPPPPPSPSLPQEPSSG